VNPTTLYLVSAMALIVVGLAGVLLRRNILKMVIALSLVDAGINLLIATLGARPGATAPIIDDPSLFQGATGGLVQADLVVDPVPQALVLTAIVIGVGVTALMLAYVIRLHARHGSLDIRDFGRLKW